MSELYTWIKEFKSHANQEMSKDLTEAFVKLSMNNAEEVPHALAELRSFQIVYKRATLIFDRVDWQAAMFIAYFSNTPGNAIMYLYAIAGTHRHLSMENLAFTFPNGFLSDQNLAIMWDKQKVDGLNYLDQVTMEDLV